MKTSINFLIAFSTMPLACSYSTKNNIKSLNHHIRDFRSQLPLPQEKKERTKFCSGQTSNLISLVYLGKKQALINQLKNASPAIINQPDTHGWNLLQYFAMSKHPGWSGESEKDNAIDILFNKPELNISQIGPYGLTVLHCLLGEILDIICYRERIIYNTISKMQYKLAYTENKTSLFSSSYDHLYYLDKMPQFNKKYKKEMTSIDLLLREKQEEILRRLCKHSDIKDIINAPDKNNATPLQYLISILSVTPENNETKEMAKLLIDAGLEDRNGLLNEFLQNIETDSRQDSSRHRRINDLSNNYNKNIKEFAEKDTIYNDILSRTKGKRQPIKLVSEDLEKILDKLKESESKADMALVRYLKKIESYINEDPDRLTKDKKELFDRIRTRIKYDIPNDKDREKMYENRLILENTRNELINCVNGKASNNHLTKQQEKILDNIKIEKNKNDLAKKKMTYEIYHNIDIHLHKEIKLDLRELIKLIEKEIKESDKQIKQVKKQIKPILNDCRKLKDNISNKPVDSKKRLYGIIVKALKSETKRSSR